MTRDISPSEIFLYQAIVHPRMKLHSRAGFSSMEHLSGRVPVGGRYISWSRKSGTSSKLLFGMEMKKKTVGYRHKKSMEVSTILFQHLENVQRKITQI
jgi:hypothetical protein